jgi:predicted RNase H-like nuclease
LPFELVTEDKPPRAVGHYIVEVHPAVAIWMWAKQAEDNRSKDAWEYKNDDQVRQDLWEVLARRFEELDVLDIPHAYEPENDDDLDALVAWVLGALWVRGSDEVTLLGNRRTGSMLIPNPDWLHVHNEFSDFLSHPEIELSELEA